METRKRTQKKYDHRLKELVRSTADGGLSVGQFGGVAGDWVAGLVVV